MCIAGYLRNFSFNDMNELYSTSCGDHIPITVDISIACIPVLESVDNDNERAATELIGGYKQLKRFMPIIPILI